jgi:hypothetical protein
MNYRVLFGPWSFGHHACHEHANAFPDLPSADIALDRDSSLTTSDYAHDSTLYKAKTSGSPGLKPRYLQSGEDIASRFSESCSAKDDKMAPCVICKRARTCGLDYTPRSQAPDMTPTPLLPPPAQKNWKSRKKKARRRQHHNRHASTVKDTPSTKRDPLPRHKLVGPVIT